MASKNVENAPGDAVQATVNESAAQTAAEGLSANGVLPGMNTRDTKSGADDSKAKGDAFEDFVVNLLADWRFKLLDRTQDAVSSGGVVAESCKNPDLHVQQKRGESTIDYYLECKYRSDWNNGRVTLEDRQCDRYRKFGHDNRRKVIIALGVGGSPTRPATLMLVPLDSLHNNTIYRTKREYVCPPTSSDLANYINNYFTAVFAKARRNSTHSSD